MIKRLILLLVPFAALAADITVELATESQLYPVYVAAWTASKRDATLSNNHLRELHQVLQFDFNYNGRTQVASSTPERKAQLSVERRGGRPDAKAWRDLSIMYLVRGHVSGNTLSIKLFSIAKDQEVGHYEVPLTGNGREDRQNLHCLSDTIHKALFGTPGIASTRILYTVKARTLAGEQPRAEVWISDYDGANARQLTHDGDFSVTPQFLPAAEGKQSGAFFYVCYKTGQPKIYLSSLDVNHPKPLTPLKGNQLMPAISHDRNQIAFISDAAGAPDLFLLGFDPETGAKGKPRQIFSARASAQASPTFSPDGHRLAFVSNKDGSPRIYLLDVPADGSRPGAQPRLITRRNRENTAPSWSPDGTKIAYSAMTNGVRQIWIYDVTKDEEWQLTHGSTGKENPAWAPDSLHLAFNSATPQGSQLYMTNLSQPKAVCLTSGPGEKRFPSWEAVRNRARD
jgi:TolB protein